MAAPRSNRGLCRERDTLMEGSESQKDAGATCLRRIMAGLERRMCGMKTPLKAELPKLRGGEGLAESPVVRIACVKTNDAGIPFSLFFFIKVKRKTLACYIVLIFCF